MASATCSVLNACCTRGLICEESELSGRLGVLSRTLYVVHTIGVKPFDFRYYINNGRILMFHLV